MASMLADPIYTVLLLHCVIDKCKNQAGCRDDKAVETRSHVGRPRIESMQQSSAIPSLHFSISGLQKIVACSNRPRSAFLFQQFLARCHPYILNDF